MEDREWPLRVLSARSILKLGRVLKLQVDPQGESIPSSIRVILIKRIKGGYHGWVLSTAFNLDVKEDGAYLTYCPDED